MGLAWRELDGPILFYTFRQEVRGWRPGPRVVHSPPAGVPQDSQGIWEAIQVVVPKVEGDGEPQLAIGLGRDEAPQRIPPLEIRQDGQPLCTETGRPS